MLPDSLDDNPSLDETCLNNGDMYTILTNKATHGRKGAIIAVAKGVSSDVVSNIFKCLPHKSRIQVKTITTYLSSAMMLTARRCFPAPKLINDRFHVQQLLSEAVDQIRIRLRWEILDDDNKKYRRIVSRGKKLRIRLNVKKIDHGYQCA